jgi:hypothetical protein
LSLASALVVNDARADLHGFSRASLRNAGKTGCVARGTVDKWHSWYGSDLDRTSMCLQTPQNKNKVNV